MRPVPLSETSPEIVGAPFTGDLLTVAAGESRGIVMDGGRDIRCDIAGELRLTIRVDASSTTRIVGRIHGEGTLSCDIVTTLHDGVDVNVTTRFVVADRGQTSTRSIVREADDCVTAKVRHEHHHLMLSREARAHAVPELFISHEKVEAGHAVTVAHVDDEALGFAQARGISIDEARAIITDGFLWS